MCREFVKGAAGFNGFRTAGEGISPKFPVFSRLSGNFASGDAFAVAPQHSHLAGGFRLSRAPQVSGRSPELRHELAVSSSE
jgi:hypothetical protein